MQLEDAKSRIPDEERIWVTHCSENGKPTHIVTSKQRDRSVYYLYKVGERSVKKVKESENPLEFNSIINKKQKKENVNEQI